MEINDHRWSVCKALSSPGHGLETSMEFSHSNHCVLLFVIAFRGKAAHICWSRNHFLCNNSILVIWQRTPCIQYLCLCYGEHQRFLFTTSRFIERNGQSEVLKLDSPNRT